MSADNRICVMQNQDGEWCVWMGSLSCSYSQPPTGESVKIFPTNEEALNAALADAKECCVLEGGVEEIGTREINEALVQEISERAERLRNLTLRGNQWRRS